MNKYSISDILTKEIIFEELPYRFDGIQIPMIQRDYAHGREGEAEIRKRFLRAIFNSLESSEELELDFVYGANKKIDKKELFIPLDGQQRLTTLYLLNWYIGNRELDHVELIGLREILSKFSYTTRNSSNKFCEILAGTTLSFEITPSEEIKESSWFFESFQLDPTVQSMLTMLDAIHISYGKDKRKLFGNLNQIRFYVLPLDGFDLTDELYIKMNARGKQLTQYENFKADLIKWIKDFKNPFNEEFQNIVTYDSRMVKYYLYFELKLDNRWTDLFWNFSKKSEKIQNKLVDSYIMQFWNRYLLNSHIIESTLSQDAIENDEIFKKLYGNQGDDSEIKYNDFDIYKALFEKSNKILKIEKVFESFSSNIDLISEIIKPIWDKNDKWNLFSESINQRQRIIFFATTKYLENNTFDPGKFRDWIRIVWNVIIDPNIRSIPAMVGAMRFINEVEEKSSDINLFLKDPESILLAANTTFYKQLEEEHFKSVLVSKTQDWKKSIIEAESHPLFQGNIRFLLTDDFNTDFDQFEKMKDAAFSIFENNDLSDRAANYLWIRALLSKSKNLQLPITLSNGRFNNWRIIINSSLLSSIRLLISEISNQSKAASDCMIDICANYVRDESQEWLYPLVHWSGKNGETLLGDFSATRKIQRYNYYGNDPDHVYLYNQTKWTEGNLILSTFRNEVVTALLKFSTDIKQTSKNSSIQDQYYKGWKIVLNREVDKFLFTYILDRENIIVGLKNSLNEEADLKDLNFDDSDIGEGWVCRKKYNYNLIKSTVEIEPLIEMIENEVFDLNNSESLLAKISKQLINN